MRRFHAENARNSAFLSVEKHPLGNQHRIKPAADCNKADKPVFIHILHHQTDLIHVGRKHDRKIIALLYCHKVSHRIGSDLIHVGCNLFFDDLCHRRLKTGDAVRI